MSDSAQKAKEKAARLLRENKRDEALAIYRQVVAGAPSDVGAWLKIANLAEQRGARAEALEAMQRVAERYARDGFLLKAIAACKQVLSIDSSHTAIQELLISLYAAREGDAWRPSQPVTLRPRHSRPSQTLPRPLAALISQQSSGAPARNPTMPPGKLLPPRTPLFSDLPPDAFKDIILGLKMHHFEPDEVIVREGDTGDALYILVSGRVRVEKATADAPIVLAQLGEGSFFGEMALLEDITRTASVLAEEPCDVLELDREMLEDLLVRHASVAKALRDFFQKRLLSTATQTHPFFKPFSSAERAQISSLFRARAFSEGEVLIQEGQKGEGLFILLLGRLEVSAGGTFVASLGPGAMFGELSLLRDAPTNAMVRATEVSWVLRLARDDFNSVARERPEILELLAQLAEDRLVVRQAGEGDPTAV